MIKIVDLFAGTGGFSIAFKNISERYKTIFGNDMEESSQKTFKLNFPDSTFLCQDINTIEVKEIPDCDIITSGFPCQPFSIAGNKKGFFDERSNVFWKLLEIIEIKKPKVFVLENVKNLVTHDNHKSFKLIIDNLEKIGYYVKYDILDTSRVSEIPHNRERVYIVGFLDEKDFELFNFPKKNERNCRPVKYFLDEKVEEKYYYEKSKIFEKIKDSIDEDITETNSVYQYRRYYVRKNQSELVPTLTSNMGTGGHNVPLILQNGRIRKLTPRECFRFQGFGDTFKLPKISDSKLYQLAGNTISIPVVELIAKNILNIIDKMNR